MHKLEHNDESENVGKHHWKQIMKFWTRRTQSTGYTKRAY